MFNLLYLHKYFLHLLTVLAQFLISTQEGSFRKMKVCNKT